MIIMPFFLSEQESFEELERKISDGVVNHSIQKEPRISMVEPVMGHPIGSLQIKKAFTGDNAPLKIQTRLEIM